MTIVWFIGVLFAGTVASIISIAFKLDMLQAFIVGMVCGVVFPSLFVILKR